MGYVYVPQGFYAGLFTSNVNYEPYDEEFYFYEYEFETDGDGNIVYEYEYEYEGEFYIDDPDALEFAPFIGYFYEFSNGISIDVGYEHYIYDYSGACCGVFYLGADASLLGDMVSVGALVKYDPDENNFDARATTMVYPVDMIGLRATLGYSESNDHYFANAGADYYFAQSWTLSADYHHATSDFTDDAAVAALSYRF